MSYKWGSVRKPSQGTVEVMWRFTGYVFRMLFVTGLLSAVKGFTVVMWLYDSLDI